MNSETEQDGLLRRYLLDRVSDEERNSIEEKFLEDDNFFEEVEAIEDELYFEYQQNSLSQTERAAFEKKFMTSPKDFKKVQFAEAFLQATEELAKKESNSLWQSISSFFSFSSTSFRYGTALATILILFFLGFIVFNNLNREPIIVEVPKEIDTETPTPTLNLPDENLIREKQNEQEELQKKLDEEKQKQEQNANKIREIEEKKEKIQREIEANRQPTVAPQNEPKTLIALVLSPLVRGGGKMPQAKLTSETKTLNLTLSIKKGVEAENAKIIVRDVDSGGQIWNSSTKLGKRKNITLIIPAKNLKRGDYEIVLINSADNEELDSYYFSVDK